MVKDVDWHHLQSGPRRVFIILFKSILCPVLFVPSGPHHKFFFGNMRKSRENEFLGQRMLDLTEELREDESVKLILSKSRDGIDRRALN